MKLVMVTLLFISCAHRPRRVEDDLVSVYAALMHAQASYLKGCVDAMKELKAPLAFPTCRDKAISHRKEIQKFMNQVPAEASLD